MAKTVKTRIQHKREIAANWASATSFKPMDGELIVYKPDTPGSPAMLKVGDGSTVAKDLPFIKAGSATTADSATKATQDGDGNTITSTYVKNTVLTSHTVNTTAHITADERTKWNNASTHASSTHAPTNAEKNQNAFSNIKVGSTTVAADTTTDTLELVGSNVTLTPDTTYGKVTIGITKANVTAALGYTPPTTDTKYTHPTSPGNKHIPSGGSSGQILRWSADGTATWGADNNTTYSQATSSALGLVKIGFPESDKNYPVELNSSGQMYVNVPWTDTNTTYGVVSTTAAGLAPKRDGSTSKFLRADGTWAVPPDNNTVYTHPGTHPASMITGLAKVATSGSYNDLSNKPTIPTIPSSLPANGGNADTVDGQHANAFATAAQGIKADNALPKAGGTMTGEIAIGQGDGKGIQLGTDGRINGTTPEGSTTATIVGLSSGDALVGHGSFGLRLRGNASRPTYNGSNMALVSDIPAAYTHPSTHPASMITAGTFAGEVKANSSGETYSTYCLRNTRLASSATNPTVNGEICWTYA